MTDNLDVILAILGVGVALAALTISQNAARARENAELRAELRAEIRKETGDVRREIGDVRKEIGDVRKEAGDFRKEMHEQLGHIRERLARLEGVIDIIRTGMQLPKPDPADGSSDRPS